MKALSMKQLVMWLLGCGEMTAEAIAQMIVDFRVEDLVITVDYMDKLTANHVIEQIFQASVEKAAVKVGQDWRLTNYPTVYKHVTNLVCLEINDIASHLYVNGSLCTNFADIVREMEGEEVEEESEVE